MSELFKKFTIIKPNIIEKGWGREIIIANNNLYCGKILSFDFGAKFSMHFHIKKTETWFCHSGKFKLILINTENAEEKEQDFVQGSTITIYPGVPHQLICLEKGEIFEVSTEHEDNDSYRVRPGNSQNIK
jgi:quercetin dioxygenase-like cupin family protein